MRALIIVMTIGAVGCAGQPSSPSSAVRGLSADSVEAQRLAAAKNLNLKVVDKDGQQLFCRSGLQTATRIPRDMVCYTADQLDQMQAQMERDLDRINSHPNSLPGH